MALIRFVNNYDDLSTDRGYQFKFYCDKCGNGYMSRFEPSVIGTAGSIFRAASSFLGGWAGSAGQSAYELQRAVGGKAHDQALAKAVEEGKQHFHQCSRCGKWVCPEVCWNAAAGQCETCAPDFREEVSSAHAQAKAEAVRMQLYEKAQKTDYAADIDMKADSVAPSPRVPLDKSRQCPGCGTVVAKGKFCPECGAPLQVRPLCPQCSAEVEPGAKFCPECGSKMKG